MRAPKRPRKPWRIIFRYARLEFRFLLAVRLIDVHSYHSFFRTGDRPAKGPRLLAKT